MQSWQNSLKRHSAADAPRPAVNAKRIVAVAEGYQNADFELNSVGRHSLAVEKNVWPETRFQVEYCDQRSVQIDRKNFILFYFIVNPDVVPIL